MKKLLLLTAIIMVIFACSKDDMENWGGPVIPVSLKAIEGVNIDNSGKLPVLSDTEVKKEAYMLGVKWITENIPSDVHDKFITDPIRKGERTYGSLTGGYSKAIKCNTRFNSDIPAGKYVSKFFKEIDRNYLPTGIDEGFVLLVAPDPGLHSFRIEYYKGDELKYFYDTPQINFF